MAGALAERVFVDKMTGVGFADVEVLERHPFALGNAAEYALFTPELVQLMRDLLATERQAEIALPITVSARKPAAG